MKGSSILIADDSVSIRDTLAAMLRHEGYELFLAGDGEEALRVARQAVPDLILLDVVMPGKTGFEVCAELRADERLNQVPILFLTSLDDRNSKLKGIEAGADDFLIKPFDGDELLLRVKTITRLDRFRKLAEERSRLEWVVRSSDEAYLLLDENDRVVFSNSRAQNLFDHSTNAPRGAVQGDPLAGKSFMELARPRFNLEPADAWESWPDREETDSKTCLYLVRPESTGIASMWLETTVFGDGTSSTGHRLVRLKDVTMQFTNQRDIWTFQSMISHKMRTPLSGILFSLELLATNAEEMDREDMAEFAQTALESASRLHRDFESVLEYVQGPQISVGEGFELGGLRPMLENAAKELVVPAVTLDMDVALETRRVNMSAHGMELVMYELLANARKFHADRKPTVEVRVSGGTADGAVITVSDDGPGIAPERLDMVWQPYFQGEKGVTFEVAGMGLGLPMIAHLLWNNGGDCSISNNRNGQGVSVELILPPVAA